MSDAPENLWVKPAKLARIIDGDTAEFDIDQGMSDYTRRVIRLRGVDTPEMPTKAGVAARSFSEEFLTDKALLIQTHKTSTGTDVTTFGRYVADVWADGEDWAEALLAAEHAKPYEP